MTQIEGAPFTMAEAMGMLDCSESTVLACIERGELSAVKRGRSWIFPRGAFLASLDALADAEAARRRAEHEAKAAAKSAISRARPPSRARGRTPPALPSMQE